MHQRRAIRESFKAALLNQTGAASRVFESRVKPYNQDELPALSIFTLTETVDPDSDSSSPPLLYRELEVTVEGLVRLTSSVDDAMDQLSLEVENAVHQDVSLGGACDIALLQSTSLDTGKVGNLEFGLVTLTFLCRYRTQTPPDSAALVSPFEGSSVEYNLDDSQATEDAAHDKVENPP